MTLLLVYLILALAVSFICSVAEAVILSVSVSFVKQEEAAGKKYAKKLKHYKDDIDKPLSSILALNTISHTVGAAGVGAQAIIVFGEASFGVVSAILTLLILFIAEILPKSIGARYWRQLASPVTSVITVMIYITYPVVIISKFISRMVAGKGAMEKVSREEIAALTEIGFEEGLFGESESRFINNMLKFQTIKANEIMTPRTVVVAVPEDTSLNDFFKRKDIRNNSRFPIYAENIDDITGYILKLDAIENTAAGRGDIKLKDIKRDISVCYEGMTIPKIFDKLLENKEQIALVVDEYGGMEGIVTLEDIIETIFGMEIVDEKDRQVDMQKLAKDRWEKKAKDLNIEINE